MKKFVLFLLALLVFSAAALQAQDATGDWQGTLKIPNKDLRIVIKLTKDDGKLRATMYSIDQPGPGIKATSAMMDSSTLKVAVDALGGSYEGKLSSDGNTISGTWTQGAPLPLILVRATKETAWEIPEAPPPPKLMTATDPSFDVATIKPNNSGAPGLQGLNVNGRNFTTRNSSLADLMHFAYNIQDKQIVGAPDWVSSERYDIAAVPVEEGAPNPDQLRMMLRKLLAERFKLAFHHEKRDLPAFVLSVGKGGPKLTPTQSNGPLPGLGFGPGKGGLTLHVQNGTLGDLSAFLQMLVLDRPVVDQTGLSGKFDLNVLFMPDDSQFNGHPPKVPALADGTDSAPGLFDAFQQQIGLKLSAEKTAVDVLVIDHVEKPSAN
jgi:uncharacterized protein (TIGR03435 family)